MGPRDRIQERVQISEAVYFKQMGQLVMLTPNHWYGTDTAATGSYDSHLQHLSKVILSIKLS